MKNKRLLSMFLAAATALTMLPTGVAYADGSATWNNTASTPAATFEVSGDITRSTSSVDETVKDYYATVAWTCTTASYTGSSYVYTWDADAQSYVLKDSTTADNVTGTPAEVHIKVTNYSNAAVDETIAFAAANGSSETTSSSKTDTLDSFTNDTLDAGIVGVNTSGASTIAVENPGNYADYYEYLGYVGISSWKGASQTGVSLGTYTVTLTPAA